MTARTFRQPRNNTAPSSLARRWRASSKEFERDKPVFTAALHLLDARLSSVPFTFVTPTRPGGCFTLDASSGVCKSILAQKELSNLGVIFATSGSSRHPGHELLTRVARFLGIPADRVEVALTRARRGKTTMPATSPTDTLEKRPPRQKNRHGQRDAMQQQSAPLRPRFGMPTRPATDDELSEILAMPDTPIEIFDTASI